MVDEDAMESGVDPLGIGYLMAGVLVVCIREKSREWGDKLGEDRTDSRNFINTAVQRAIQRTQRFIRWVRDWIYRETPWRASIALLREVWGGIYS